MGVVAEGFWPRLVCAGGGGADDVCTGVVRLALGLRAWRLL